MRTKIQIVAAAVLGLAAGSGGGSPAVIEIGIDFGATAPATAHWNPFLYDGTGGDTTVSNLVRLSDGVDSGVAITVTGIDNDNGLNHLQGSGSADASIYFDHIYGNDRDADDTLTFTISGLDDAQTYGLFGGFKRDSDLFEHIWTVGSDARTNTFDGTYVDGYETFGGLSPSGGEIVFSITDLANGDFASIAELTIFCAVTGNVPPSATAQQVTTLPDTPVAITLAGSDWEGSNLTYAVVSPPARGALATNGALPYLTYTPAAGYAGTDGFSFSVNDGEADSAPATVSISVTIPAHYDDWIGLLGMTSGLYRPGEDADGDLADNVFEWATGSNPTQPASVRPLHIGGNSVRFSRNTNAVDMVYYLQSTTNLVASNGWTTVATNRLGAWSPPGLVAESGTNNPVEVTVPVDTSGENEFYRLGLGWKNPNIVLIYADDLGYGDLGCYGATKVQTPNVDRLASQGRRFTDAHSASAVCTPSRYGMLTGEYPFRQDIWAPTSIHAALLFPETKTTIADMLKSQGYETACFGKWHLGFGDTDPCDWNAALKPGPLELGFDYYFGVPVVNSAPPYVFVENHGILGWDADDPLYYTSDAHAANVLYYDNKVMNGISGGEAAHLLYRDYDLGNQWAARTTQWIEEHRDHPFFMYIATTQIHHPFTPDPRFVGTSECGLYGDFIHEFDWIVGQVMDKLDELGLTENTLIIVTSDNGGMLNDEGKNAWNAGHKQNGDLLGWKFGVWEGGHRIPLIARWPGKIEAGSVSGELMSSIDFMATFAALTGRGLNDGEGIDSFNMLPAFLGDPAEPIRDTLLLQPRYSNGVSYRKGDWMYIPRRGDAGFSGTTGGPGAVAWTGLTNSDIDSDGNYVDGAPTTQLYDLANDVSQTVNVVTNHPDIAATMASELATIRSGGQTRP
ncbi:sulfatase-like hydrolase/transferase [Pontiella sp.]|uniref:sulfatase-like hydrolase/transferase n=1 Tax=Pontiella sp. TaxID=2837462 RepID=UPI0035635347